MLNRSFGLFISSLSHSIVILSILFYTVIQDIPNLTLSRELLSLMRNAAAVALEFGKDELFYFPTLRIISENYDVTNGFDMSPHTTPWA